MARKLTTGRRKTVFLLPEIRRALRDATERFADEGWTIDHDGIRRPVTTDYPINALLIHFLTMPWDQQRSLMARLRRQLEARLESDRPIGFGPEDVGRLDPPAEDDGTNGGEGEGKKRGRKRA